MLYIGDAPICLALVKLMITIVFPCFGTLNTFRHILTTVCVPLFGCFRTDEYFFRFFQSLGSFYLACAVVPLAKRLGCRTDCTYIYLADVFSSLIVGGRYCILICTQLNFTQMKLWMSWFLHSYTNPYSCCWLNRLPYSGQRAKPLTLTQSRNLLGSSWCARCLADAFRCLVGL